ncbi:MAG: hypothetical protein ACYCW6_29380 [Candidatus Xenobia bacterium]
MARDMVREATRLVKDQVARLKPVRKAAILLHSLPSELSREVARNLSDTELQQLTAEQDALPDQASVEAVGVLNEFLHVHRLWPALGVMTAEGPEILASVHRWAARNPRRLASLLRESWLG